MVRHGVNGNQNVNKSNKTRLLTVMLLMNRVYFVWFVVVLFVCYGHPSNGFLQAPDLLGRNETEVEMVRPTINDNQMRVKQTRRLLTIMLHNNHVSFHCFFVV